MNLVIFAGVEDGYEASIGDVFGHSPFLGVLVLAVLVAGPVSGVFLAVRSRRPKDQ